jgi:cellulose synthase/poly-beta-1,6-N-acetylglucosamine synthase-like glycosyltransferase
MSSGEVVVFLDDDVTVPPGWLEGIGAALAEHPTAGLVGGWIRSMEPDNVVSQAFETLVIRHEQRDGRWFLASACLVVRREAFGRLGGFDERYPDASGEDWDLCRRAHAAGVGVVASERFGVFHRNPTRLRQVLSRSRSYAASAGLTSPLSSLDRDRRLRVGAVHLPAALTFLRPWIRAVRTVLRDLPVELAVRVRVLRASRLGSARRAAVLVVHLPWLVSYVLLAGASRLRADLAAVASTGQGPTGETAPVVLDEAAA